MPLTRLPLTTGVSGTLPVGNGGTNVTTAANLANTGNLVLLNTNSSSTDVSSFDFDSTYINSTYDKYLFQGVVEVATDNVDMEIYLSSSGTFETGASDYAWEVQNIAGATLEDESDSKLKISRNGVGNASGENINFNFYLFASQDSTQRTTVQGQLSYLSASVGFISPLFGGQRKTAKVNDGLRLKTSSGNIQGTISLYGIKE